GIEGLRWGYHAADTGRGPCSATYNAAGQTETMPDSNQNQLFVPGPVRVSTVIGTHLDKILSSRVFKSADSLRELLRFIVHETVAGRGDALKEYVLGVSVLRRGESFNPKADAIVRLQMRRLREHLERYYATEGRDDPLRIDIPKGTYAPTFRPASPRGAVGGRAAL